MKGWYGAQKYEINAYSMTLETGHNMYTSHQDVPPSRRLVDSLVRRFHASVARMVRRNVTLQNHDFSYITEDKANQIRAAGKQGMENLTAFRALIKH